MDDPIQIKLHTRALELVEKRGLLYGTALREARAEFSRDTYFDNCEKLGKEEQLKGERYDAHADYASDCCIEFYKHKTVPANFSQLVRKMTLVAMAGGDVEAALRGGVADDVHTYTDEMMPTIAKKYSRAKSGRRTIRRY